MKTKTLFTSVLLLLFATLSTASFAAVKQDRNVSSFTKIDASIGFVVHLSQGSTQSVVVEMDEEYINDVQTTVKNGTLHITLKNDKNVKTRNIKVMNVYITIPAIDGVTVSSGAKIEAKTPISNNGTISVDLSSAGSFSATSVTCKVLKIEQSSASKCSINVAADKAEIDISSAANLNLSGKVDKLEVEGSSGAKVDVSGLTYNTSDVDMSSGANLKK